MGRASALMSILKSASSTLDIISGIKRSCRRLQNSLPAHVDIHPLSDQSIFVHASIQGVIREGAIAACLTGLMILLFLGSWRSTLIIAVSIPLSVLTSLIVLSALGRNDQHHDAWRSGAGRGNPGGRCDRGNRKHQSQSRSGQGNRAGDSGRRVADRSSRAGFHAFDLHRVRAHVFPLRVAQYLFVPLAEAVVFAMLASYLLSRTLVPTMARYLLDRARRKKSAARQPRRRAIRLCACRRDSKRDSSDSGSAITACWNALIQHRKRFRDRFLLACVLSFALIPLRGAGFLSRAWIAANSNCTCARRPARASRRRRSFAIGWRAIFAQQIPPSELATHHRQHRAALQQHQSFLQQFRADRNGRCGYSGGAVEGSPPDATEYVRALRAKLAHDFPGVRFYELPADIVSQILNFGLAGAD